MASVKWNWAVGVTTAPRRIPTVDQTLESLAQAGWNAPRLFVEPCESPSPLFENYPASYRVQTLGAFPNWYLGLSELYLCEPHADAYLMCQDDGLFAYGLREYLEETLWPSSPVGVVSLYCPCHEHMEDVVGYSEIDRGWQAWGAVAYVFSNPGLRELLSDSMVLNHRHHGPDEGLKNIDSIVGSWCQRRQLPYFVHVPTLVQHIGKTSTIRKKGGLRGHRVAVEFDPEFPLKQLASAEKNTHFFIGANPT